ncbi:SRPBCC family protein [Candidatus Gracilibacteria bacterium]|nr:SRPBCC family protein [Candidatus Gracilibacteria bacterium]
MVKIETVVQASLEKVWERYTKQEFMMEWNHASDDWHCPQAENDLRVGGRLNARMEAKDGSFGFDFGGTYSEVRPMEFLAYAMDDGRKVEVSFVADGESTKVVVDFDAETENPVEMQKAGWQAILDNFKKCAEG